MRPLYETAEDRRNERSAIATVEARWGCKAFKLPKSYWVDFALIRGTIKALCEVKCRTCRAGEYSSMHLSLMKYLHGKQIAAGVGIPYFALFEFADGIVKYIRLDDRSFPVCIGGRTDRGDDQDRELVIEIPYAEMITIAGGE